MIKHTFPAAGARLGNKIFADVAMSAIAQKYNYKIQKFHAEKECLELEIQLFSGQVEESKMKNYTDSDLINLSAEGKAHISGINYVGYCQHIDFFIKNIKEINKICNRGQTAPTTDGLFIHIRLGDLLDSTNIKPLNVEYYEKCIEKASEKNIFISSDTPNHPMIQHLVDKYAAKRFISINPVESIKFGRSFSKIATSFGTFSWWIAFLSGHNNIFYPSPQNPGNFSPFLGLPDWNFV